MGIFQQIPVITHVSQNCNNLLGVALQTNMKTFVPFAAFSGHSAAIKQ